jgi:hypothetical protein
MDRSRRKGTGPAKQKFKATHVMRKQGRHDTTPRMKEIDFQLINIFLPTSAILDSALAYRAPPCALIGTFGACDPIGRMGPCMPPVLSPVYNRIMYDTNWPSDTQTEELRATEVDCHPRGSVERNE